MTHKPYTTQERGINARPYSKYRRERLLNPNKRNYWDNQKDRPGAHRGKYTRH